tara:strand:- start:8 stop:967 length:960 start_codon:yes stop_codon:yes gene_type:complete
MPYQITQEMLETWRSGADVEPTAKLVVAEFTDDELILMKGARTFPLPAKKAKKAKKSKKEKKVKQPSAIQNFKKNCVEEYAEDRVEGWTQVDAPWGECYAAGLFLDKKFINTASAELVEEMPKKHFLTWDAAVEFAEKTEDCEAITKTTAGYELRKVRCAIKNTPSGFKGGLRTWLRDSPYDCEKTYAELTTTEDAHIRVKTPAQAKKIAKINADAADEWEESNQFDPEADTDVEEEEEVAPPVEEEEVAPPVEEEEAETEAEEAETEAEEEEEPEVDVEERVVDGKTYDYDPSTNTLYDLETHEEIGTLRDDGNIDYE